MKTELKKNKSKPSLPKFDMRKWLNIKSGDVNFHSDYSIAEGWLMDATNGMKHSVPGNEGPPVTDTDSLTLSMFVGTWNVGGKSPNEELDIRDWLMLPSPADIFVLGFQEIIPLNAGNVLGPEDSGPATKWLALIHQALNSSIENSPLKSKKQCSPSEKQCYSLVASKQMVGIFLCVWIRTDLYNHITNLKMSCVGRGIMGYLGNKGSVSISMTLYHSTFCFVCTHLASGEKEGDEIRRNLDVSEILKKTKFSHLFKALGHPLPPQTILEHDKIIWLGDLNYRLAAGYDDTHELLKKNDWQALLEKDQLRIEQRAGRVFKDWKEGKIYFAPTYKYLFNSDQYVAQTSKEKRRTPAWCDRILWKGEGVEQIWYVRGESKFSDHRPVYSLFSVHVDLTCSCPSKRFTNATLSSSCVAKVQAEEQLLLLTREKSCTNIAH